MKLKDGFITHNSSDEQILIDVTANNFSGLVKCNPTAGVIVDCLKTDTTEQEILEKLRSEYEGDEKVMAENLKSILDKLRNIGAIDE